MTIPVVLDLQVTGLLGDLVPSPRIFLAGGALASSPPLFLFVPGTCSTSEDLSGLGSTSWLRASAGIPTGRTGA